MRALVTGGAGFIGSHVVDVLLENGYQVQIIDDLSTGSLDNLTGAKRHESELEMVVDRVETAEMLDEWAKKADVIYHFAAAVGVKLVMDEPIRTLETNLTATSRLLRAAAHHKCW